MDPKKAAYDNSYCHAAISALSDLEMVQSDGKHCDVSSTGPALFTIQSGMPVYAEKATVLTSFFLKLQNDVSTKANTYN